MTGAPQNLGVDTFPDPVSQFGAPRQPFWIWISVKMKDSPSSTFLIEGVLGSKNLFSESGRERPKT